MAKIFIFLCLDDLLLVYEYNKEENKKNEKEIRKILKSIYKIYRKKEFEFEELKDQIRSLFR